MNQMKNLPTHATTTNYYHRNLLSLSVRHIPAICIKCGTHVHDDNDKNDDNGVYVMRKKIFSFLIMTV